MRYPETPKVTEPAAVISRPAHCPACRSQEITTASKVVNDAAYWRCSGCGEVWNVSRRREAARYVDIRKWGR
jgi:predicted Zn finger-like uncharacterized protein